MTDPAVGSAGPGQGGAIDNSVVVGARVAGVSALRRLVRDATSADLAVLVDPSTDLADLAGAAAT